METTGLKDRLGRVGILVSIPVVLLKEGKKLKTNNIMSANLIALGLWFCIILDANRKTRGRGWFTRMETE